MADGNGMLPFTQRAQNTDMAITNSPAKAANTLVLFLVPMRKSLPMDPQGANASLRANRQAACGYLKGCGNDHRKNCKNPDGDQRFVPR